MLPSDSKGITNSPSNFPSLNILLSCLLIIFGKKRPVILDKSLILFSKNAI